MVFILNYSLPHYKTKKPLRIKRNGCTCEPNVKILFFGNNYGAKLHLVKFCSYLSFNF